MLAGPGAQVALMHHIPEQTASVIRHNDIWVLLVDLRHLRPLHRNVLVSCLKRGLPLLFGRTLKIFEAQLVPFEDGSPHEIA